MSQPPTTRARLRRRLRRGLTLALATGLALSTTSGVATASPGAADPSTRQEATRRPAAARAGAAQVDAPIPVLDWQPCYEGSEALCANPEVPLDYDDPTGPTLTLDVLKVPAGDPANRIGSLFVNPGGPGGSAAEFAAFFPYLVRPKVSQRFDIIGVDPRGVGPSAPMVCRNPDRYTPPRAFPPLTKEQARSIIRSDRWFRTGCRENPGRIVGHMSTADTARDMDLIRQAVGDDQLTYYGVSYGSYLGATYAAMFPDRVRAVLVDGVLDPVAWSTGRQGGGANRPFSARLNSGYGAWQALTSAFAECDRVGRRKCRLSGESTEKWLELTERLRRRPVKVDGGRLTYQDVVGITLSLLYSAEAYRFLMRIIDDLHRQVFRDPGPRLIAKKSDWSERRLRQVSEKRGIPGPYGWARYGSAFVGVACSDTDNPAHPMDWWGDGIRADRRTPWFGRFWTWVSSTCANWPAATKQDRFTGPWFRTTSEPVLVVGNTYDPATPLHGARALNRMLGGSRLLVLNGWGHGAIATGPCIDEIYRDYLIDGTLPAEGKVCRPRSRLFG